MSLIERGEDAQTVGDDGYRRIRSDIVFGRLRPSQKLKLEGLRASYGVSVSTLREILSRLTAEGFVIAEGKRGFEVAPVSAHNLKELAELRVLLETHAMQVSFANADVEWEGRVVSAHHKLASIERLMESGIGEPEQWKRYDSEYQMVAFLYRGGEPAAQHVALLESALKRDAETAKDVLITHVSNCVEHALATSSLR